MKTSFCPCRFRNDWLDNVPFPDLSVGLLMARTRFGRVYYAHHGGKPVVAKVVLFLNLEDLSRVPKKDLEISSKISHPNLVKTICHRIVPEPPDDPFELPLTRKISDLSPTYTGWILTEFCNAGTLVDAVEKGIFRNNFDPTDKAPKLWAAVRMARDLASALSALHGSDYVHGELSSAKVLLSRTNSTPLGYVAKVSGFGLSKGLRAASRADDGLGALAPYTAPELIIQTLPKSKEADMYAFGVICWELVSHVRAWANMLYAQVIVAVALKKQRLKFLEGIDAAFVGLAERCMSHNPMDRPAAWEARSIMDKLAERYPEPVLDSEE
eukprot:jgi/Botrbrau1/17718/Bobra.0166s0140.1